MKRWTWNIACLLSFALAIAMAALWITSHHLHHRLGRLHRDVRYTLHLDHGHLRLAAPSATLRPTNPEVAKLASRLRNDQVEWSVCFDLKGPHHFKARPASDTPAEAILRQPRPARQRVLLAALEHPDKFVAAHADLAICSNTPKSEIISLRDGTLVGAWDGLLIELKASTSNSSAPCYVAHSQLPAIRDLWHDRLDVQMAAVPFWPLTLPPLLLPAAWVRAALRQRRRRTLGLCPCCAYDLRATPTRCPECGDLPDFTGNKW